MDRIDALLNRESGLLSLCGENDMRSILRRVDEGDADARLALEMYVHRIKKYLGAYLAVLGGADAIVFTGGIGENAAPVRSRVCRGMEELGIVINDEKNDAPASGPRAIDAPRSRIRVLVIPTDEEREIARLTRDCIAKTRHWRESAP